MNWEDPIVADVRRTREELSAKFDFDLPAIFADLRARQSSAGDRLVKPKCDRAAEQIAGERGDPVAATEANIERVRFGNRPSPPCRRHTPIAPT